MAKRRIVWVDDEGRKHYSGVYTDDRIFKIKNELNRTSKFKYWVEPSFLLREDIEQKKIKDAK